LQDTRVEIHNIQIAHILPQTQSRSDRWLGKRPIFHVSRYYPIFSSAGHRVQSVRAPVSLDFAFRPSIVEALGLILSRPKNGSSALLCTSACFGDNTGELQMAANPVTPNSELELKTERNGAEAVVHASGRITTATAPQLQSTIRGLISGSKRVVLDLKGVNYIDSTGIGALVSIHMAAGRAQCAMELTNLQPRIRDLFELTRLTTVFENHGGYRGLTPE
jgi:anti-sigma B factor antagonist